MAISEKQKITNLRKQLSIELCNNFLRRLNPAQTRETKLGAVIAIRNFIKESKIDDPILMSCLVDTIIDPDKEVRQTVIKVIKDIVSDKTVFKEIKELLEIKQQESSGEIKKEISELLQLLRDAD